MSINRVIISGNLTRDPELRATASGTSVLSLGVAVNDRRKNPQTGEWEDFPNFIDCTMFGTRAESVSRFLSKGSKVAIEGKLRWSQWEQDGQKRSKIEVIVDEVELMSRRQDDQGAPQGAPRAIQQQYQQQPQRQPQIAPQQAQQYAQPVQYQQPPQYVAATIYDEQIPF